MLDYLAEIDRLDVAPLAGAWIETGIAVNVASYCPMSRPSRARGLKLKDVEG